ncbi:hypothetical protein [Mongoliitalea lutea]|uniref:Uncharacterized protein n=1 Tax=Mongoliitalea lutea TaxID=849756 RepID=A0A8J3D0U0_9BACT|nr:hypothetical protein [Mongoliitalea lutea]GHB49205.1 hypothetical protein GCM10008106_32510 [Mongoliitalea lutea]
MQELTENYLNNVQITAYLSPHPLDEDSHMEEEFIDWLPGYVKGESEEGEPSYMRDENIELYERIEQLTEDIFRKALLRMGPLLEGYLFKNIQIFIDYQNFSDAGSALAGYNHADSNPGKGIYVFHVNQRLLNRYLHFLEGNLEAIPDMNLWEHEIIHLLDHWELVKASAFRSSDLAHNNLIHYLIKYRKEGTANFLDLLDGKLDGIQSREEAKSLMKEKYELAKNSLAGTDKTSDEQRTLLYAGYNFYAIGPWIMLDMIDEYLLVAENEEDASSIEYKIQQGISLSEEGKLNLVRIVLMFDNEMFLERLDFLGKQGDQVPAELMPPSLN